MKDIRVRTTIEIEHEFNEIKRKINSLVLREDSSVPPAELFEKLDEEFSKIQDAYANRQDVVNLLHVKHNYLWSKSVQLLNSNPTESMRYYLEAFHCLLERNHERPYGDSKLDLMLGAYQVVLIKSMKRESEIDSYFLKERVEDLMKQFSHEVKSDSDSQVQIVGTLARLLVIPYEKEVSEIKPTFGTLGKVNDLGNRMEATLQILQNSHAEDSLSCSTVCELLYRLRKKETQVLSRQLFFERNIDKREKVQRVIETATVEMRKYAKRSLEIARRVVGRGELHEENFRILVSLKEIDFATANYYFETYHNKDAIKGWDILDSIRRLMVKRAFEENVPLSEDLLKYYEEEWSLLDIFTKIHLLQEEVTDKTKSLRQEWESDVFAKIVQSLGELKNLFRYEIDNRKGSTLKIIASSFSGQFTEYYIHQLCLAYRDHSRRGLPKNERLLPLLHQISSISGGEEIKLNQRVVPGGPDLDLLIGKNLVILLKNARIDSDEVKKIWREVETCRRTGISTIYYAINFVKNISSMDYIRKTFETIIKANPDIEFHVVDIEDLVSNIIENLDDNYRKKMGYLQRGMVKLLDY